LFPWLKNLSPDGGVTGGLTTTLRRIGSAILGGDPGGAVC